MSSKVTHTSSTRRTYAQSLLELAREQNQLQEIAQELADLVQVIEADAMFRAFLTTPSISSEERHGLLQRVFKGKISTLLYNFLGVLNNKNRLGQIPAIAAAYDDLLDDLLGKVEVDVTVAQRLSPEQLEEVRKRISAVLGKDAVVHQYVDDNILGGLVLRVGDKLIDASVKYQLQALRRQMLEAAPK